MRVVPIGEVTKVVAPLLSLRPVMVTSPTEMELAWGWHLLAAPFTPRTQMSPPEQMGEHDRMSEISRVQPPLFWPSL